MAEVRSRLEVLGRHVTAGSSAHGAPSTFVTNRAEDSSPTAGSIVDVIPNEPAASRARLLAGAVIAAILVTGLALALLFEPGASGTAPPGAARSDSAAPGAVPSHTAANAALPDHVSASPPTARSLLEARSRATTHAGLEPHPSAVDPVTERSDRGEGAASPAPGPPLRTQEKSRAPSVPSTARRWSSPAKLDPGVHSPNPAGDASPSEPSAAVLEAISTRH
jgi:hypothetical protein